MKLFLTMSLIFLALTSNSYAADIEMSLGDQIMVGGNSVTCEESALAKCERIGGDVYCGFNCTRISGNVYCTNSLLETCDSIGGTIYCGRGCERIAGSVYCYSGGKGTPATPAQPAR